MNQLGEILRKRLISKGLGLSTIPAFIRNIANSLTNNPYMSLQALSRQLHLLGWDEFELDDYTLELIIACLESDAGYKTTHQFKTNFNLSGIQTPDN